MLFLCATALPAVHCGICGMWMQFDSIQLNIESQLNSVFLLGCPVLNVKQL